MQASISNIFYTNEYTIKHNFLRLFLNFSLYIYILENVFIREPSLSYYCYLFFYLIDLSQFVQLVFNYGEHLIISIVLLSQTMLF